MPSVMIYIREDDVEKWKLIEKKSEFIHDALNTKSVTMTGTTKSVLPGEWKSDFVPKPPDPEIGYSCCQKQKPCKHWSFDGNQGLWVNELTGKTREIV